ncbi:MAG TPA: acyl-CoA synthetase FdrA [Candidatus Sulfomarinibacteraceae bacterium]|nr:acyl-CoA synthetase FdrA [Candidatus Sulfomarinibacteraceae bacterium]
MSVRHSEVRSGAYYDSVVLMQLQRGLAELPGVLDAGVVMGTAANRELLEESGLMTEEAAQASADDLVIVVQAQDDDAARAALGQVDSLLKRRRSAAAQSFQPRSLDGAVKQMPDARWVLISVPGRYAADVAREALTLQRHVFLYSDNVSLQEEVELKHTAREKGLLVMGPDCGTAIVNGVGLGFANRVRRGDVGLVAASGTGLQAITAHVHQLGGGISQAIGTGGRDLSDDVQGITTLQGLSLLDRDPETEVIVLVSKPPSADVAARLLSVAQGLSKPVVVYFMGQPVAVRQAGNLHFAFNLADAADLALVAGFPDITDLAPPGSDAPQVQPQGAYLRALFSGGTLAYELLLGLQNVLSPIYSNAPLRESQRLENALRSHGHTILDLGEDQFTQGRLHPMMDNELRIRRLRQEADDPETGLILLDVVLGEGAHPDPASELAPVIAEVVEQRQKPVGVLLVGTDEDPQDIEQQAARLEEAGATVYQELSLAVEEAVNLLASSSPVETGPPVSLEPFSEPLAAINVGLESFYNSLRGQGAEAVHVQWRPPAGGNEKMMALLAKLKAQQ